MVTTAIPILVVPEFQSIDQWSPLLEVPAVRVAPKCPQCKPCNLIVVLILVFIEINSLIVSYKTCVEVERTGVRASLIFIMVIVVGVFLLTKRFEWLAYVETEWHRVASRMLFNCN